VADCSATEQFAQVVIRGVAAGKVVEIDGLGVFYPDAERGFRFEPSGLPQVFIAYVREDVKAVERLPGNGRVQPLDGCAQAGAGPELAARHRERHRNLGFLRGLLFGKLGAQDRRVPIGSAFCPGLRAARAAG
jgi:hypothetical protein